MTLKRPWIFSELVKAQILSLFCWVYCVQLRNVLFDHHRLHGCHHHFPPRHCSHNHPRRSRWPSFSSRKVLAELRPNQDVYVTRTHCCRHKCFPVGLHAQHLLRTQILYPGHKKMFLILFRNIFCPQQMFPSLRSRETSWATMCPQQCVLVYQGLKECFSLDNEACLIFQKYD